MRWCVSRILQVKDSTKLDELRAARHNKKTKDENNSFFAGGGYTNGHGRHNDSFFGRRLKVNPKVKMWHAINCKGYKLSGREYCFYALMKLEIDIDNMEIIDVTPIWCTGHAYQSERGAQVYIQIYQSRNEGVSLSVFEDRSFLEYPGKRHIAEVKDFSVNVGSSNEKITQLPVKEFVSLGVELHFCVCVSVFTDLSQPEHVYLRKCEFQAFNVQHPKPFR